MFSFGSYVFDERSGDLRRGDESVRLTPQMATVLHLLVARNGDVVSRSELRDRVWPDTTVEFDQGVNFCIRQLRIVITLALCSTPREELWFSPDWNGLCRGDRHRSP